MSDQKESAEQKDRKVYKLPAGIRRVTHGGNYRPTKAMLDGTVLHQADMMPGFLRTNPRQALFPLETAAVLNSSRNELLAHAWEKVRNYAKKEASRFPTCKTKDHFSFRNQQLFEPSVTSEEGGQLASYQPKSLETVTKIAAEDWHITRCGQSYDYSVVYKKEGEDYFCVDVKPHSWYGKALYAKDQLF
jgi:hypothetical protein